MINFTNTVSNNQEKFWVYSVGRPTEGEDLEFRSMEWAKLVLSSKGAFALYSDYGEYIYHWGYFNGDFRENFVKFSSDYILSKIEGEKLQWEPTVKDLIWKANQLSVPKALVAEYIRELNQISSKYELYRWAEETSYPLGDEWWTDDFSEHAKMTAKWLLPRLKELIVKELEEERSERGKKAPRTCVLDGR